MPADEKNEAFRARVVEAGCLSPEDVAEAFARYRREQPRRNFASFLLQEGLLGLEQLTELARDDLGGDTVREEQPSGDRLIGQELSGCRLERLLGRGGMGAVYLAKRVDDGDVVVVKLLAAHLAEDARLRARFQREGEVLQKLRRHPNVVRIHSVHGDDERPHLVMEHVDGLSLERVLEERWSLPGREATRIARDIASGLAAIHTHGILHRDVKPANVLLTSSGQVKIVDFGLAKDVLASGLTLAGQRLGTPYYMAPEQWGDHELDARCDVFALGATVYHLVVGEPPFLGPTAKDVATKIMSGDYTAPRRISPDVSPELEQIIAQMLVPDRRFRYANMEACARDLDRALRGEPPAIPSLIELGEDEQGPDRRRHPLIPGRRFTVGRDEECEVRLRHASVSRQHARIRRETTGFVLRDLGSTFGTYVGRVRVTRPLVLKDNDTLRLGKVYLRFRDPGRAQRPAAAAIPRDLERLSVPEPALRALVDLGDKRTIAGLLEGLTPDAEALRQVEATLADLFGHRLAEEVIKQRTALESKTMARLPRHLSVLTGQNRGSDPGEWLQWWDGARGELPQQVDAARPVRAQRLRVVRGEPAETDVALEGEGVFLIGRDAKCNLRLANRTVSRLHATIHRLHRRLVVRDEGSRLGTVLNKRRVHLAFFDPGDTLDLGDVRLVLEEPDPAPPPKVGLKQHVVSPTTFQVLEGLRHPSVVTALVGFLHEAQRLEWIQDVAGALFTADDPERQRFVVRMERLFQKRAQRARKLLPGLMGADAGSSLTGWNQLLAERRSHLVAQVLPRGWLKASRGLYGGVCGKGRG